MIPDNPKLEGFFASLRLTEKSPDAGLSAITLLPERLLSDQTTTLRTGAISAVYDPDCGISLDAAIQRLDRELQSSGHPNTPAAVRAVIAVYLLRDRSKGAIRCLNETIGAIAAADVVEHWITGIPCVGGFARFDIGEFEFGELDQQRLSYWCERVGCDYFKRYPGRHRGDLAIQRRPTQIALLDIPSCITSGASALSTAMIIDGYFDAIGQSRAEQFRADVWAAQEVLVAAGAPFMNLRGSPTWTEHTFISVYRNVGRAREGYFCPIGQTRIVDFAASDRRIPEMQKALCDSFGFTAPAAHEIGETLRTFCRFIAQGRLHESEARVSEAFLHHVIALDLLFGDRDGVTSAVARRAAACVSSESSVGFDAALRQVKALYDTRSKHVHCGRQVQNHDLVAIRVVCRAVLNCLLRVHDAVASLSDMQSIAWWHKQLDYVAVALEAARALQPEELRMLGLRNASTGPAHNPTPEADRRGSVSS
jgi:hypothetical protein